MTALATLLLIALAPASAFAAFSYRTCTTTGWEPIEANIGAKELPMDISATPTWERYARRSSFVGALLTNPNVLYLSPSTTFFRTEQYADYITVNHQGSPWTASPTIYQGDLNSTNTLQWTWTIWQPTPNVGHTYTNFQWTSDHQGTTFPPPSFSQIDVQCRATQVTTPVNDLLIASNERYDGLLLGQNDVVYFNVWQWAGHSMLLLLDSSIPGVDFDLHASATTSLPDGASPWKSVDTGANEAIYIPSTTATRRIYVAVRAYGAKGGTFWFHADQIVTAQLNRGTKVCADWAPTAAEKTKITETLRDGAARFLTLSQGNFFMALRGNLWVRDVLIHRGSEALGGCHGACIARSV